MAKLGLVFMLGSIQLVPILVKLSQVLLTNYMLDQKSINTTELVVNKLPSKQTHSNKALSNCNAIKILILQNQHRQEMMS